ncbi:MAG: UDP-glucose/GDP-mannose dehydrogenase family protein [Candidatus Cybelea sp.]
METLGPSLPPPASTLVTTNGLHRQPVAESMPVHHSNGRRKIAVIGTGYVGLVTGTCLAELGQSVICLDTDSHKIAMLRRGEVPFFEPHLLEMTVSNHHAGRLSFSEDVEAGVRDCGIVFIAVGTPMRHDDHADLSAIWDVAALIGRQLNGPKIVVLKSTVPVDTCEMVAAIVAENAVEPHRVDVVSNPEFLREGSAVADFMRPDRIVVGTSNPQTEAIIRELYAPLDAPFVVTNVRTSEMIKYAANAFLATKVSFINEIANICELVEVDVKAVASGIGFDHRIGTQFMSAGIGYGGSCFPKDVRALERTAHGRSYEATLLRSVESVNRSQIPRTFAKIEKALDGSVEGRTICVLGLAFKPNTSDIREAPAIHLIELFLRSGARVNVHDPIALEEARARVGDDVTYCLDMYEAINGCDVLVLATEWNEYKSINFRIVRKLMRGNVVFDGRNIFDAEKVTLEGLRYIGVGRAKEPSVVDLAYVEAAE